MPQGRHFDTDCPGPSPCGVIGTLTLVWAGGSFLRPLPLRNTIAHDHPAVSDLVSKLMLTRRERGCSADLWPLSTNCQWLVVMLPLSCGSRAGAALYPQVTLNKGFEEVEFQRQ